MITTLLQGRDTPGDLSLSSNLPSPLQKPTRVDTGDAVPLNFEEPVDRTGMATLRCRKKADPSKKRGVKRKASEIQVDPTKILPKPPIILPFLTTLPQSPPAIPVQPRMFAPQMFPFPYPLKYLYSTNHFHCLIIFSLMHSKCSCLLYTSPSPRDS